MAALDTARKRWAGGGFYLSQGSLPSSFDRAAAAGFYIPSFVDTPDTVELPNSLPFNYPAYRSYLLSNYNVRALWGLQHQHLGTWIDDSDNGLDAIDSGGPITLSSGMREFDGVDDVYVCPSDTIDQDFCDIMGLSGSLDPEADPPDYMAGGGFGFSFWYRSIDLALRWLFFAESSIDNSRLFIFVNAAKQLQYVIGKYNDAPEAVLSPPADLCQLFPYTLPEDGRLHHVMMQWGRKIPAGQGSGNETKTMILDGRIINDTIHGNQIPPFFRAMDNCSIGGAISTTGMIGGAVTSSSPPITCPAEADLQRFKGQLGAVALVAGSPTTNQMQQVYWRSISDIRFRSRNRARV